MPFYDLSGTDASTLLQEGLLSARRERGETVNLLAHIAEIDARGLFVTASCSSMFAYCLKHYKLSEDAANARIQVARVARKYPFLFEALQDGRLHLTGVRLLAPHLTPENARDLVAAATHRTMTEIQRMIAQRFPLEEPRKMTQTIRAIPSAKVELPVSKRVDPLFEGLNGGDRVDSGGADSAAAPNGDRADVPSRSVDATAPAAPTPPASVTTPGLPPVLAPPARHHFVPERYLLRFTVGRDTHDKLRYAQMLSSHTNPGGSIEPIMSEALDLYIEKKEKRRFAATTRPRPRFKAARSGPSAQAKATADSSGSSENGVKKTQSAPPALPPRHRYIPAEVRRKVWERDEGRCTSMSEAGERCNSTEFVEYDHVVPLSQGGQSTVEGLRLMCRAHNQYEAEMAFGPEFMQAKREEARARRRGQGGSAALPSAGDTNDAPDQSAPDPTDAPDPAQPASEADPDPADRSD